jgi:hypothetical protein
MSAISYLRLDEEYDPVFDPGAVLVDAQAVEQAIKTRLMLFQGEWWEDLNEGTPMFQKILGSRASVSGQQIMSQALAARVSGTPYVTAVEDVTIGFNSAVRNFSFQTKAQTAFGLVSVSN